MNRIKLQNSTVEQLIAQFLDIALRQHEAMRRNRNSEYNRLFDQMEAVEQELRKRTGDQRRALLPLLDHPNPQVRLKSAIATLSIAPVMARQTLQTISDREEYPEAVDAREMMRALDEGRFIPS